MTKINFGGGGSANDNNKSGHTPSTSSPPAKNSKQRAQPPNLGVGFVAPDGGWGWLVVVAAGCSNVRFKWYNSVI